MRLGVAPIAASGSPFGARRVLDLDAQAAYVSDALASDDPALVALVLKEIGTLRRIPVALDENPPLGEVLRTLRELGFDLEARKAAP